MRELSYIEKLLDGAEVEWKPLNDICSFRRGSFPQPYGNNEWYDGENSMPFVQVVDVLDSGFALKDFTKKRISKLAQPKSVFVAKGTVIVTLQGTIGRVAITQYDCFVDRTLAIFNGYAAYINKKYFTYQLKNKFDFEKVNARGSTLKTITKEEFSKFLIPIPCPDDSAKSLAIQGEIVRILDAFTSLTTELTTELTARKKQYNHYRDQLFTFDAGDFAWKPLGELGELVRGNGLPKKDFTEIGVPAIHYGQIYTYYGLSTDETISFVSHETAEKLKKVNKGDVVITNTSENFEDVGTALAYLGEDQAVTGDHATIFKPSEKILGKYFAYFTQTIAFEKAKRKYAKGAKVIDVSAKDMSKIDIPIPYPDDPKKSLVEQARIVDILDKFDALTNSISEGLPREIELRYKQYEYYRDLLLNFPKPQDLNHPKAAA